jgi:DNA-directed RNA polymerase specialized sigma24 family protein
MPIYDRDTLRVVKPEPRSEVKDKLKLILRVMCNCSLPEWESKIMLARLEGKTYRAIAEFHGISTSTVESIVRRAIKRAKRLHEMLEELTR